MDTADIEKIASVKQIKAIAQTALPSTVQLLMQGGDARIAIDPQRGLNRYGCQPRPAPDVMAFGSSTASNISQAGFLAADRLRNRLVLAEKMEPAATTYLRELERIRGELTDLCGLSDLQGLDMIFAASGTDLHLIAAQLIGTDASQPALIIMVEPSETGSGVAAALTAHHFNSRSAHGDAVAEGAAIEGGAIHEIAPVRLRMTDGSMRPAAAIDTEVASIASRAYAAGRRVLLIMADCSKSGCIAPSPACAVALQKKFADRIDVMVDACQFRLAPATLRTYLQQDFIVALTGSKFVTGPSFCGALLLPAAVACRLREQTLPRALCAYSVRGDWPRDWLATKILDDGANFGLLLRWEAALEELRMFRAIPESAVAGFLHAFAQAVQNRLQFDPLFEALPVSALDRLPLLEANSWDHIPTIFPFLLFRRASGGVRTPLSGAQTAQIYRMLQTDLSDFSGLERMVLNEEIATLRCQLGQPVACGERNGIAVSALRLCASARLIVEATSQNGRNAAAVIDRALSALDKTAFLILATTMLDE